jgi:hypothetical protein
MSMMFSDILASVMMGISGIGRRVYKRYLRNSRVDLYYRWQWYGITSVELV